MNDRPPETDGLLACPSCKNAGLGPDGDGYICPSCEERYPVRDGVPVFIPSTSSVNDADAGRAEFWNSGWEKRNAPLLDLDRDGILEERRRYLDELTKEGYPSATELSTERLKGKTFLNIGCGGGYEGLLFSGYGANYIGVDFSHNAARYTRELIEKAGFAGVTYQAEAENLPFGDASIGFIYSSGVLHHTPNTEEALKELRRVLKPGGTAMIGLYATNSIMFMWYRLHAIIRGNWTRNAIQDWLNANTEGEWQTEGRLNHWTATYTKAEFRAILERAGFGSIRIRQTPVQISNLPVLGKLACCVLPKAVTDLRIGPFGGILMATCGGE